jgi:hypothetical protein
MGQAIGEDAQHHRVEAQPDVAALDADVLVAVTGGVDRGLLRRNHAVAEAVEATHVRRRQQTLAQFLGARLHRMNARPHRVGNHLAPAATRTSRSRCRRSRSFTVAFSTRRFSRSTFKADPPLSLFADDLALPSGVLGPVADFHGFHVWISSACRTLRSGVQVVAMLVLQ